MELPKTMEKVFKQAKSDEQLLYKTEREMLGFHHADLGGILLKSWKLSPRLVESITYHHAPINAQNHATDAAIIHSADVIVNIIGDDIAEFQLS